MKRHHLVYLILYELELMFFAINLLNKIEIYSVFLSLPPKRNIISARDY